MPRSAGTGVRVRPGLHFAAPEVRVVPDQQRLASVGLSARDLAQTIDVLNEGMRVKEITDGARRIDLILRGPEGNVATTQGIEHLPVVTPSGIVPTASGIWGEHLGTIGADHFDEVGQLAGQTDGNFDHRAFYLAECFRLYDEGL